MLSSNRWQRRTRFELRLRVRSLLPDSSLSRQRADFVEVATCQSGRTRENRLAFEHKPGRTTGMNNQTILKIPAPRIVMDHLSTNPPSKIEGGTR